MSLQRTIHVVHVPGSCGRSQTSQEKHPFPGLFNKVCLHWEIISGKLRDQYILMSP